MSPRKSRAMKPATARGDDADEQRVEPRASGSSGCTLAKHRRQQAVARHGVEDARLAVEQHQHHRRQAREGADLHQEGEPRQAHPVDRHGDRRRIVELGVGHDADQHRAGQDVEDRADRSASRGCRSACRAPGSSLPRRRSRPPRSRYRRRRSPPRRGSGRRCRTVVGVAGDDVAERAADLRPDATCPYPGGGPGSRAGSAATTGPASHRRADDDEGDDDRHLDGDDDVVDGRGFRNADGSAGR